jgi:hypothetical protein
METEKQRMKRVIEKYGSNQGTVFSYLENRLETLLDEWLGKNWKVETDGDDPGVMKRVTIQLWLHEFLERHGKTALWDMMAYIDLHDEGMLNLSKNSVASTIAHDLLGEGEGFLPRTSGSFKSLTSWLKKNVESELGTTLE